MQTNAVPGDAPHHSDNITDDDHGYQTDYIYANGKRIAKGMVDARVIRVLVTQCTGCSERFTLNSLGSLAGYTVKTGDKLFAYSQLYTSTIGGITVWFDSNSSNTDGAVDSDGQVLNADTMTSVWHARRFDLSAYAGKVISKIDLVIGSGTIAGSNRGIWFQDIVIVSADGAVQPIYNGQLTIGTTASGTAGSPLQDVQRLSPSGVYPLVTTTYYHSDHLGSSRLTTNSQGYPTWSATYLPYGWEYNASQGIDHFKFAGKERDAESSLDYIGARYLSSAQGRFLTPDSPFKDQRISIPQSWNLYTYVRNNPLIAVDPDGKKMEIVIYNTSSQHERVMQRVADGVAKNFREAGVKNVSTRIINTDSGIKTAETFRSATDGHAISVEVANKGAEKGVIKLDTGETAGNHVAGSAVVDQNLAGSKLSDDDRIQGLINATTHEIAHEVAPDIGGAAGAPGQFMSGHNDENWLKDENLEFSDQEKENLQRRFNETDEKEAPK